MGKRDALKVTNALWFSGGGPVPHAHGEEGIRVELQKELQRALDRRQRRQRSQSVSSTSRERHKDVSPDKYPRHTHPRRPSSRLHRHVHILRLLSIIISQQAE